MSIRWPSEDDHQPSSTATSRDLSFLHALQTAIEHQVPLIIGEGVKLVLTERIFHKLNSTLLHIVGEGSMDTRPILTSSGHSVFQCGGRRARLILDNIVIEHTCFREHHKDIGACVFGLNQSLITITNCHLRSHFGFAVWGVQRANIELQHCDISSVSRSGCVSFGRSCFFIAHCRIHHCRLHGVCTRGDTILSIDDCRIEQNGKRGVYAYHTCTLYMKDSIVIGTESNELAAIDVWSCSGDVSCRIASSNTSLIDDDVNASDHDQSNHSPTTDIDGSILEGSTNSFMDRTISDTIPIPSACTLLSTQLGKSTAIPLPSDFKSAKSSFIVPGQLSIYLSNCKIYDNCGIGIRIIHQKDDGLSGTIDNCCCYDNMKGNYVTLQYDVSTTTCTNTNDLMAEELPDTSDLPLQNTQQELSCISIWEYERDDPFNMNECGWKAYDTTVRYYLEQQWHRYLERPKNISVDCLDTEDDDGNTISTLHTFSLCSPYGKYFIDFETMIQTNVETHYTRRIRRRIR